MARKTPDAIQQYRGTTAQHASYTGKVGELTVDTDKKVVVVHDGATAGGVPMAREDRTITGDAHLKVNGSTEGTLAGDVALTVDMTSLATDLVSTDANNGLSVGTDNKLYAKAPDANLIIRAGDKILHDAEGKVAADLSMTYDQPSGKLKLIGHDGSTEVANVTIPSSTSVLKGVELTNGKPDAGGEEVEGDYHLTLVFRDQNGAWSDAVGVQVTTTKGSAGTAEYSTELAEGGTSVAAVRAVFNGDDKTVDGGSSPATVTFDDTSSASVPFAVSGTTVSGTVSFTPQVGLKSGVYLHFIWALSDGSVADTYVDVTDLVDVYTAGQGITIAGHTISAKLGTGIKFDESGNIVVDFTKMSEADLAALIKQLLPSTGGGLTTDEDGKLVLDFSQLTPTQKEDLISQIVQEGGGLSVDENGQIYIDFDSMPTDKFEAMLKSIRVPIWLTANKNFYVNQATGSDTLDAGRGESESKPFKTIQAAVDYIADNYNLSNYNATIRVAANYNSTSEIVLKSYNTVGGSIIISGHDQDDLSKTVIGRVHLDKSCIYMLRNLTVKVGSGSSYIVGVRVQSGRVDLQNVLVDMSDSVVSNGSLYAISAEHSGLIRIYSTNSLEVKSGCTIKVGPAMMGTTKALLSANSGGNIQFSADILVDGSADLTYSVTAINLGNIHRTLSTLINPGRLPTFTANGTITGSRYRASANGIIATISGGPEFFPGSTKGITSAGGQYT